MARCKSAWKEKNIVPEQENDIRGQLLPGIPPGTIGGKIRM